MGYGALVQKIKSILGSYSCKDDFLNKVYQSLIEKNLLNYKNISVVFEAIIENPTNELTIDYNKSFCPLLCYIVFDVKKKIIFPKNEKHLFPVANPKIFNNWGDVIQYKNQSHQKLLDGDMNEEPEGFVVWTLDENYNQIGIKLKHLEYYAAHKPNNCKNILLVDEIQNEVKYIKLKERFIKFKYRPDIKDLINIDIIKIYNYLFDTRFYCKTKKEWAIVWKCNQIKINYINDIINIIEKKLLVHYSHIKFINRFSFIMETFLRLDILDEFKIWFLEYINLH